MKILSHKNQLLLIFLATSVIAIFRLIFLPTFVSRPDYYNFGQQLSVGGANDFILHNPWGYTLPSLYPLLINFSIQIGNWAKIHPLLSIYIFQAITYALTSTYLLYFLQHNLSRTLHPVIVTILPFAYVLHPMVILNIGRIEDNALSASIFLIGILLTLSIYQNNLPAKHLWFYAVVQAISIALRPNLLLTFFVSMFFLIRKISLKNILSVSLCAMILPMCISLVTKNRFELLPRNGAYNFFIGNNPLTKECVLANFSAEPCLQEMLHHYFMIENNEFTNISFTDAQHKMYVWGLNYITHAPTAFIETTSAKIFNFFRPDIRATMHDSSWESSFVIIFATILALPISLFSMVIIYTYLRDKNLSRIS